MTTHLTKNREELEKLAADLGDLRYDSLATFLEVLSAKLRQDATADARRGRPRLAGMLDKASLGVGEAGEAVRLAWKLCEPYMKDPEE
jgi:hypothetical protein